MGASPPFFGAALVNPDGRKNMEIKINRGTKTPRKVHHVNVGNSVAFNLKPIYAGGDPFEAAKVFGCGNPKSTGSTGGERQVMSRRNVSKFTIAGSAG
jgi:hypothetical protein